MGTVCEGQAMRQVALRPPLPVTLSSPSQEPLPRHQHASPTEKQDNQIKPKEELI